MLIDFVLRRRGGTFDHAGTSAECRYQRRQGGRFGQHLCRRFSGNPRHARLLRRLRCQTKSGRLEDPLFDQVRRKQVRLRRSAGPRLHRCGVYLRPDAIARLSGYLRRVPDHHARQLGAGVCGKGGRAGKGGLRHADRWRHGCLSQRRRAAGGCRW